MTDSPLLACRHLTVHEPMPFPPIVYVGINDSPDACSAVRGCRLSCLARRIRGDAHDRAAEVQDVAEAGVTGLRGLVAAGDEADLVADNDRPRDRREQLDRLSVVLQHLGRGARIGAGQERADAEGVEAGRPRRWDREGSPLDTAEIANSSVNGPSTTLHSALPRSVRQSREYSLPATC